MKNYSNNTRDIVALSNISRYKSFFLDDFISENTEVSLSRRLNPRYVIVPTRKKRFYDLREDDKELITLLLSDIEIRRNLVSVISQASLLAKIVEEATGSMNSKVVSLGSSIVTFDNLKLIVENHVKLTNDSLLCVTMILYHLFKNYGLTAYQTDVRVLKVIKENSLLNALYSAADYVFINEIVSLIPDKNSFNSDKLKVSSYALAKRIYDDIFLFYQKLVNFSSRSSFITGSLRRLRDYIMDIKPIKTRGDIRSLYEENDDFVALSSYMNLVELVTDSEIDLFETPAIRWKQEDEFTRRILTTDNMFFKVINLSDCIKYFNIDVVSHLSSKETDRKITALVSSIPDANNEKRSLKYYDSFDFQGLKSMNYIDIIPSIKDASDGLYGSSYIKLFNMLSKEMSREDSIIDVLYMFDEEDRTGVESLLKGAAASLSDEVYIDKNKGRIVYGLNVDSLGEGIKSLFKNVLNVSFCSDPLLTVISHVKTVFRTHDLYEDYIIDFDKYKLYSFSDRDVSLRKLGSFRVILDAPQIGKKQVDVDISKDIMRTVKDVYMLNHDTLARKIKILDDLLTVYKDLSYNENYSEDVINNFISVGLIDTFKNSLVALKPFVRYIVFKLFEKDNDSFNKLDNAYMLSVLIPLYVDVMYSVFKIDDGDFKVLNKDQFAKLLSISSYNLHELNL